MSRIGVYDLEYGFIPFDDPQPQTQKEDLVSVVRCKDCKHYWKNMKYEDDMDCVATCLASPEDDAFCSEGERKDDEQV